MDKDFFDDIHNQLNDNYSDESPNDVLYDALEGDYEEVIVIGKRDDEIFVSFDYQDDVMALGMLKIAETKILGLLEED